MRGPGGPRPFSKPLAVCGLACADAHWRVAPPIVGYHFAADDGPKARSYGEGGGR